MQVVPGAWRLAAVPVALAIPLAWLTPLASLALVGVAVSVLYLHRDPDRSPAETGILSPADGRISVLREEWPATKDARQTPRVRVGVFMHLTDVHVNRAPLPGRVTTVARDPGGHWPAFSKASDRNERVTVECEDHAVVLIAGALARRIHPYVSVGDEVDRGQRISHISFGSRVDVLLPPEVGLQDVRISPGDRVRAGETVLADH